MENAKVIEYVDVLTIERNGKETCVACIYEYDHDERHPNRKWAYRIGFRTYYSETAKTLNEMVNEYISLEVDWSYCGEQGIQLKFVTHRE